MAKLLYKAHLNGKTWCRGTGGAALVCALPAWITNSPEAARRLKAADAAYDRRVAAASRLLLADKIEAIRVARIIRDAAYRAVLERAA